MLLGVNDLKQFATPTGWDPSELLKYALADGTTYDQIVTDIAAGLALASSEMMNDPIYGGLITMTNQLGKEYRDGTANGMQERTEYQRADARRGRTIGHMFPLKGYDRTMGWTWDFLRKARRIQMDADVADAIYDVRDNWERAVLTRLFSSAENQLGISGYDVPFVNGGTGNVTYTPPPYRGQRFTSAHTHYDRKTTSSHADALNDGMEHLREHGIIGPYIAIVSHADISAYTALTGFVKPDRGIQYVRTDASAAWGVVNVEEPFFGLFEGERGVVRLYASQRVPTGYLALFRSYGVNDPRNPLAMRYEDDLGAGPVLMRGEAFREFPLENAVVLHDFGIGVNDRLNAYLCRFDSSGSYTDPDIS